MSGKHARAVRKSDLYEYCGISKSLLERIALLIIGPAKDGQKPDPDEGWCVASQDTLAAMHGCSPDEVSRQVAEFEKGGWLTVKRFRDGYGHKRCHYAITPEQLEKIKAREMRKYPEGHLREGEYIRAKMPQKRRGEKSLANLKKGSGSSGSAQCHAHVTPIPPSDKLSSSQPTSCPQASRQTVGKPADNLSGNGLSFIRSSQKKNHTSLGDFRSSCRRKKEQATAQVAAPPATPAIVETRSGGAAAGLLHEETVAALRHAGCPDSVVSELGKFKHYSQRLNSTTNVLSCYMTLMSAPNHTAKNFAAMWMPELRPKAMAAGARANGNGGEGQVQCRCGGWYTLAGECPGCGFIDL